MASGERWITVWQSAEAGFVAEAARLFRRGL
jgi:hypothetical protein